ncbi:MAG: universal stress protein [Chlorobium sp.]|jgi:universal stress protein A|nr:MAG: universal stress protein [Chlorobium sp.]
MTTSLKKIICAVDFSVVADSVVRYAAAIYNGDVELTLLYVAPAENSHGLLLKKHLHDFSRYSDMLSQRNADSIFTVEYGDPAAEILEYAKEHNADMILLGSHGTTAIGRLLVGSTAETVMRQAPCPVVILKSPDNKNKNHGTP